MYSVFVTPTSEVFHRVEILEVNLPSAENVIKNTKIDLTQEVCGEEVTRISEMKRQIEKEMQQKREKIKELDKYSQVFSSNKVVPLKTLHKGTYDIMAIREVGTRFGRKYILVVALDGRKNFVLCYSNQYLENAIDVLFPVDKWQQYCNGLYLTLFKLPIAQLHITGWGWTPQRNVIVYCQLFIASDEQRKEYAIPTLTSRIENDIDLDVSRIENPDRAVNHPCSKKFAEIT